MAAHPTTGEFFALVESAPNPTGPICRHPGNVLNWKESQLRARELGLQLYSVEVSNTDKYEGAFKEAIKARSTALAVMQDP